MATEPIIQVENLRAQYDETVILENVSFEVATGEIFVILGGSGCGKSTLLRHMVGLDPLADGRVVVDGVDITTCGDRLFEDVLRKVGILFQSSGLIGSMSIGENIALPLIAYTDLPRSAINDLVQMKLCMVDLSGYGSHLPSELSGGMKKRAGLARAMALNPKLLFLDEPSAGLDPVTAAEIDNLILSINKNIQTTVIIVTHELRSIMKVGQTAIMLDKQSKGIIARGAPQKLKHESENPFVQKFFNPAT